MNKSQRAVSLIVLAALVGCSFAELSCKDENGKPVDWWAAIKIPKMSDKSGAPFNTGFSYAYITSNDVKGKVSWKLGKNLVQDPKCIYGQTLEPLYSSPSKYSRLMYNDAPPHNSDGKESGYLAHAKGVFAVDSDSGFWMIHSIPKFPEVATSKYAYPDSGRNNGQSSLCISIKTAQEGKDILGQIALMRPNVYEIENAAKLDDLNELFKQIEGRKWSKNDGVNVEVITSKKGVDFQSFSRSHLAAKKGELYSTVIAPKLDIPLIVETWRRGAGGVLASNCTKSAKTKTHDVMNVSEMQLEVEGNKSTGSWPYLSDHSKMAISAESEKPYVCIGDINRMNSQLKRGGGTVCMKIKPVWTLFRNSIAAIEPCGKA